MCYNWTKMVVYLKQVYFILEIFLFHAQIHFPLVFFLLPNKEIKSYFYSIK